jgi:hypothetical protein
LGNEFLKHTLSNILTKGVTRKTYQRVGIIKIIFMKNLQSKFKKFALPKESAKTIKGGNEITIPLANMLPITDPLRKKDKR